MIAAQQKCGNRSTVDSASHTPKTNKLPRQLFNVTCIYCGSVIDENFKTKEHVVGRRFVPKGSFEGNWNLIAHACLSCNSAKSKLEDDISAITMQPTAFGDFAANDPVLHAEARRKAAATSRRTGKPVSASQESLTIKTPLMGASVSFDAVCSPQVDRDRAFRLAQAHVGAFFYFITYDAATQRGGFCQGEFVPVEVTTHADWGSAINRSFMTIVAPWPHRVIFTGARGYFKIAIRRHPSAECWSWAVEWNKNMRIVGLMGDPTTIAQVRASLTPNPTTDFTNGTETFRFRAEVRLPPAEDVVFQFPEANPQAAS